MYDRHLDSFVKVAELGSFARAAEELFVSPNAVIKHVNLLERDLKLKLFDRSNSGVSLTPAGEEIYRAALKIMAASREAVAHARLRAGCQRTGVRLVCSTMRPPSHFKRLWARVAPRHPDLMLEAAPVSDEINAAWAILDLLGVEADFALNVEPSQPIIAEHQSVVFQNLYSSPASFLVPMGHRLAAAPPICLTDLEGERLALQVRGYTSVSDRIRGEIARRHLAIEVVDTLPYDVRSLNRALADNDIVMSCDEFANAHPSFVNVPCAEGYEYPICLMYARSASAVICELADELVAEAHRESGAATR